MTQTAHIFNSNWLGPVWMPVNVMLIRVLLNYYLYYGDNFKIEYPTGSGKLMNLFEAAKEIGERPGSTFLRNEQGKRPVYGGTEKFQTDPNWRDLILFMNISTVIMVRLLAPVTKLGGQES